MSIGTQYLFIVAMSGMAAFLILIVLIQRGRGGGLSGAFGGAGGQSAFGAKAGDTFTKITMWTAFIWIVLCIASVLVLRPDTGIPVGDGATPGGAGAGAGSADGTNQPSEEGEGGDAEAGTGDAEAGTGDAEAGTGDADAGTGTGDAGTGTSGETTTPPTDGNGSGDAPTGN